MPVEDDSTQPTPERIKQLVSLANSYNQKHNDEDALATINQALALKPDDEELLEHKSNYLWNVSFKNGFQEYLTFCNEVLSRDVGNELYFRFHRAKALHSLGIRWEDGKGIVADRSKCLEAISELKRVKTMEPNFVEIAEEEMWVAIGWDEEFGGFMEFPEFRDLIDQ